MGESNVLLLSYSTPQSIVSMDSVDIQGAHTSTWQKINNIVNLFQALSQGEFTLSTFHKQKLVGRRIAFLQIQIVQFNLSPNRGESLNKFLSPDPDPYPDHLRGGSSHEYNTCVNIQLIGAIVFELRARTDIPTNSPKSSPRARIIKHLQGLRNKTKHF